MVRQYDRIPPLKTYFQRRKHGEATGGLGLVAYQVKTLVEEVEETS